MSTTIVQRSQGDFKVRDGMDVYDTHEEKIGTVDEVYDASAAESDSGGGYLRVPTGFLGKGTEHHIPFSAISDVRDERIHLSVAGAAADSARTLQLREEELVARKRTVETGTVQLHTDVVSEERSACLSMRMR